MNEENREIVEEQQINPRDIEAEVIGELKKESIGKPTLVIGMLIIFVAVMITLPIINDMLNDENSTLYKFINGVPVNTPSQTETGKDEYLDGNELQMISSDINVKFENLILSNMYIKKNNIYASLKSFNGVIDFDKEQYYAEIYTSKKDLLSTIKLTGKIDYQETKYELSNYGLNFNDTLIYYIKIKKMTDGDFPVITLETDESGLGSLVCTKENRRIEYTFKNNYLININDHEEYSISKYNDNEYLNLLQSYKDKSTNLKTDSRVEETEQGFVFNASINLEQEGYVIPTNIKDNNYFELDKEAKIIKYEQAGKGFDCK